MGMARSSLNTPAAQEITGTIEPWDHWDKAGWMEIRPWHQLEKWANRWENIW